MQFVRYLVLCLSVSCVAFAQQENGNPLVAKHESERRGSFIEQVGGNAAEGDAGVAAFLAAMAPAENDNDKWTIYNVSSKNCGPCEKLKKDFRNSQHLASLVNVQDHTKSWAHYQEFEIENQLQNWRFSNVKFEGFPTIIVEPPRSGRCGSPSNFIKLTGYNGDDKTLLTVIRSEIRKHSAMAGKSQPRVEYTEGTQLLSVEEFRKFQEELRQQGYGKQRNGEAEFAENAAAWDVIDFFFTGESMTTLITLALVGWLLLREYRKESGQKVAVPDAVAQAVEKRVKLDDATVIAIVTAVRSALGHSSQPSQS
jgi:hypothetical protein